MDSAKARAVRGSCRLRMKKSSIVRHPVTPKIALSEFHGKPKPKSAATKQVSESDFKRSVSQSSRDCRDHHVCPFGGRTISMASLLGRHDATATPGVALPSVA